ncbi:MAG: hypothetical protein H7A46_21210 [Verrucomicrobiales bacterium]|nr:hypothetical protein [Verrucomicrobiales bacterium]
MADWIGESTSIAGHPALLAGWWISRTLRSVVLAGIAEGRNGFGLAQA